MRSEAAKLPEWVVTRATGVLIFELLLGPTRLGCLRWSGPPMSGNADLEAKIIDAIYRGACDPVELSRALALMTTYFNSLAAALGESDKRSGEHTSELQALRHLVCR